MFGIRNFRIDVYTIEVPSSFPEYAVKPKPFVALGDELSAQCHPDIRVGGVLHIVCINADICGVCTRYSERV